MSRVGKNPIVIPEKVTVALDAKEIKVHGPKGELVRKLHPSVTVVMEGGVVQVNPIGQDNLSRSMWGTMTRNIKQMIEGVTLGFKKILEIEGVGFRAAMLPNGKMLRLSLGFSHDIIYIPCDGVSVACPSANKIEIDGIDSEKVGETAAAIRRLRKPEPFKGKGIRYAYPKREQVRRKQGKKK